MRLILSQAQQYCAPYVEYGLCVDDPRVTVAINLAIERLLPMLNPEKTIGRYQFDVVQNTITMPREVKTVLSASVSYPSCTGSMGSCGPGCTAIFAVKSRWYEMLPGGPVGWLPCAQNILMDLGTGFSTFADPSKTTPYTLRLYADIPQTSSEGFLVIKGTDINGNSPFSIINNQYIDGQVLQIPWTGTPNFEDTPQMFVSIGSITKPQTAGRLRLYGVDATGAQIPLAMYEPDELNPDYRRYLVTWPGPTFGTQPLTPPSILTVLAKKRFVRTSSPYADLLITNIGALQNALMALKYEKSGTFDQAQICWRTAAQILDTDTKDNDGDYSASMQVQEWFTGGDVWNLR